MSVVLHSKKKGLCIDWYRPGFDMKPKKVHGDPHTSLMVAGISYRDKIELDIFEEHVEQWQYLNFLEDVIVPGASSLYGSHWKRPGNKARTISHFYKDIKVNKLNWSSYSPLNSHGIP